MALEQWRQAFGEACGQPDIKAIDPITGEVNTPLSRESILASFIVSKPNPHVDYSLSLKDVPAEA